jgi:hypothetical protein
MADLAFVPSTGARLVWPTPPSFCHACMVSEPDARVLAEECSWPTSRSLTPGCCIPSSVLPLTSDRQPSVLGGSGCPATLGRLSTAAAADGPERTGWRQRRKAFPAADQIRSLSSGLDRSFRRLVRRPDRIPSASAKDQSGTNRTCPLGPGW